MRKDVNIGSTPPPATFGYLEVRPAVAEDAEDVLSLREDLTSWLCQQGIAQWSQGDVPLGWIERAIAEGSVHVVRRDGVLAASVTVRWEDPLVWPEAAEPAGYIHMLMVSREFAGSGLGRQLLGWAEELIRLSGLHRARLDCVRTNGRLRTYYKTAGYRLVGYKEFAELEWAKPTALYEKLLG